MKLGEALSRRADLDKKITDLKMRIGANALVQEGDMPTEPPEQLLADALQAADELCVLIKRINRTNATTRLEGDRTLSDALTERDSFKSMQGIYLAATSDRQRMIGMRATRSELRVIASVDVRDTQAKADAAARRFRELDARIQEVNWTTELI